MVNHKISNGANKNKHNRTYLQNISRKLRENFISAPPPPFLLHFPIDGDRIRVKSRKKNLSLPPPICCHPVTLQNVRKYVTGGSLLRISGFAWIRIILSDPDLPFKLMDPDSDPIWEVPVPYIGNTCA